MGPRPEDRGKHGAPRDLSSRVKPFNGATTRRSWKTRKKNWKRFNNSGLQWGHDPKIVENANEKLEILERQNLQWGHDPKIVENRSSCRCRAVAWLLQWGHDPKIVENDN